MFLLTFTLEQLEQLEQALREKKILCVKCTSHLTFSVSLRLLTRHNFVPMKNFPIGTVGTKY